jgi:Mrp family chromosome partitioning ATPase/capsular polysaccharide biosynthesis protein
MNENASNGNTAGSAFAPIWRRKWLILAVAIVVAVATYEYYKHQPAVYSASTQLYLGGTSEPQTGTGSGGGGKGLSARTLADQVGLINSAVIGAPVRKRFKDEGNVAAARGKVKAAVSASSDFITIATEAHTPKAARNIADAYAAAYIKRQRSNYVRSLTKQISTMREQLRRIETPIAKGKGKGGTTTTSASATIQAANLESKISVLESDLSTFAGVQQVHPAISAPLPVEPAPKQNAIFGFVLGLILAAIAAFLFGRVDRRLRTLEDVEGTFGQQILAALPEVKAPVLRPDGRRYPAKPLLEPLRRLQTTLAADDFAGAGTDHRPRTILFMSADAGDGRSSLIANLARVQSEGGDRVAVVEADFRRPTLAALLGADGEYGLADVLTGRVKLDEALRPVKLEPAPMQEAGSPLDAVAEPSVDGHVGSVSLIAGGGVAANPPALIGSGAMRELLVALAGEYDVVLVDAPPPLEVSDAMPLVRLVDGIVLIARLGHTREASAYRLTQLLQRTTTAPVLGAVGNCVSRRDINRYGFSYAPVKQSRRGLLRR